MNPPLTALGWEWRQEGEAWEGTFPTVEGSKAKLLRSPQGVWECQVMNWAGQEASCLHDDPSEALYGALSAALRAASNRRAA
jgi:hypothetical protein